MLKKFGLQISMFWPVCRSGEHGQKFPKVLRRGSRIENRIEKVTF